MDGCNQSKFKTKKVQKKTLSPVRGKERRSPIKQEYDETQSYELGIDRIRSTLNGVCRIVEYLNPEENKLSVLFNVKPAAP